MLINYRNILNETYLNQKEVDVIITTLNAEKYLEQCLKSLLSNDRSIYKVIICDGDSVDNTSKIINDFTINMDIVKYNVGRMSLGDARNFGIKKSNSKYITFLDADDKYISNKIEIQKNILNNETSIDAVFSNFIHYYPNNNKKKVPIKYANQVTKQYLYNNIFKSSLINLNTLMIRREYIENNNINFAKGFRGKLGDDWQYIFDLIIKGCKIKYIDAILVEVTCHYESLSTKKTIQWKMRLNILNMFTKYYKLNPSNKHKNDYIIWSFKVCMLMALLGYKKRCIHVINSLAFPMLLKIFLYIEIIIFNLIFKILGDSGFNYVLSKYSKRYK